MDNHDKRAGLDALHQWLARLDNEELPVLDSTVRALCAITADADASNQALGTVVLRDASLTSGVLRAANSPCFNHTGYEIRTVSRAIALLGFETVRTIGVSLSVIDRLLKGRRREALLRTMRESVIAATHARLLAQEARNGRSEEVFIASLLLRVGEMAFWCFSDDAEANAMAEGLAAPSPSGVALEREILGFRLTQLSGFLAREWHLGDLVEHALQARRDASRGVIGCIRSGHRVEAALREHGWSAATTDTLIGELSETTGHTPERMRELLEAAQTEGRGLVETFGIPAPSSPAALQEGPAAHGDERPHHPPDPVLQLVILRELSRVIRERTDTHTVLEMILEGLHRGVGLDRTLITIYNQSRTRLRVRYRVGDDDGTVSELLGDDLNAPHLALVQAALQRPGILQLSAPPERWERPASAMRAHLGGTHAAMTPLAVHDRVIGLIYVDRIPSGRPLDDEAIQSVMHFTDQASLALEHIKG